MGIKVLFFILAHTVQSVPLFLSQMQERIPVWIQNISSLLGNQDGELILLLVLINPWNESNYKPHQHNVSPWASCNWDDHLIGTFSFHWDVPFKRDLVYSAVTGPVIWPPQLTLLVKKNEKDL